MKGGTSNKKSVLIDKWIGNVFFLFFCADTVGSQDQTNKYNCCFFHDDFNLNDYNVKPAFTSKPAKKSDETDFKNKLRMNRNELIVNPAAMVE